MAGDPNRVRDLLQLAEIWKGLGLRVLEMPGWRDRGRMGGNAFEVLGCHHTGGAGDNDRLLRDGDLTRVPPVPGPLCNVALHANGDVVLVASGRANHFGKPATWENSRSLGVEATGPRNTSPRFPNYDAYVALAAGFCIFKGNADPRRVVRDDVGIPVHLVAAHKEVALLKDNPRRYGRKPDPDFEGPAKVVQGALPHGFSVKSLRLIDKFRDDVHVRMTQGDDMTEEQAHQLEAVFKGLVVEGSASPAETVDKMFQRMKRIENAMIVPGTGTAEQAFNKLFEQIQDIQEMVKELKNRP